MPTTLSPTAVDRFRRFVQSGFPLPTGRSLSWIFAEAGAQYADDCLRVTQPGALLRYAHPELGEESLRFRLIEDLGERVLIESLDFPDWRIAPRETVAKEEVQPCAS